LLFLDSGILPFCCGGAAAAAAAAAPRARSLAILASLAGCSR